MTFLDFDGIASGESIVVEGTVKFVFSDNTCHVDIVDPFPENDEIVISYTSIDIHFHCFDDIDSTTEEADESGFLAFQPEDAVVVLCKIEGNTPERTLDPIAVTGFVGEVRACWRKGVFNINGNFYIADLTGDASSSFAFVNTTNTGLAGDDINFVSRRYWRCDGGSVFTGTVNSNGINNGDEVGCSGFPQNWVRALNVTDTSDDTGPSFAMIYQYNEDPDDYEKESIIMQAVSTDKIVWTNHLPLVVNAECKRQRLTVGTSPDEVNINLAAGWWEIDDTYALSPTNGALRLFRIGRQARYTESGTFSGYQAWTAISSGVNWLLESGFTLEGFSLTSSSIQIIQVMDPTTG